jgi:hypothetical protein
VPERTLDEALASRFGRGYVAFDSKALKNVDCLSLKELDALQLRGASKRALVAEANQVVKTPGRYRRALLELRDDLTATGSARGQCVLCMLREDPSGGGHGVLRAIESEYAALRNTVGEDELFAEFCRVYQDELADKLRANGMCDLPSLSEADLRRHFVRDGGCGLSEDVLLTNSLVTLRDVSETLADNVRYVRGDQRCLFDLKCVDKLIKVHVAIAKLAAQRQKLLCGAPSSAAPTNARAKTTEPRGGSRAVAPKMRLNMNGMASFGPSDSSAAPSSLTRGLLAKHAGGQKTVLNFFSRKMT